MPSPDAVYDAMLVSGIAEVREVWEKVLVMRGWSAGWEVKPGRNLIDGNRVFVVGATMVRRPALDELWTLAKEKAGGLYFRLVQGSEQDGCIVEVYSEHEEWMRVFASSGPEAALLSYLIGRQWKEGGWK